MRGYVGDLIFLLDEEERPVALSIYRGWAYLNLKPGEIGEIDFPLIGGHSDAKEKSEANKKDLKENAYYVGSGRGSHVARWTGTHFAWPAMEMGIWTAEHGAHYEDGGCFLPMEEIPEKYPTVAQVDQEKWEREHKMTAEDLWKVIEQHCGAERMKDDFLHHAAEALDRHEHLEYRFQGALGFGGKLYLDMDGRARVGCYSEDESPERVAMMNTANKILQRMSGR